jgi:SAM-dependent methyltransferase
MNSTLQSNHDTAVPRPLIKKISNWLAQPPAQRRRKLRAKLDQLLLGRRLAAQAASPALYVAHQPDSYSTFGAHPEFDELYRKFSAHNRPNNSGDSARLWSLILNCKQVMGDGIPGDFAELGVWRGNTAAVLAHFAAAHQRQVDLFDTFSGFDSNDIVGIDANKPMVFGDTSMKMVREVIGANQGICNFVPGYFPGTLTDLHRSKQYAVVSLDCDLYEPMKAGLDFFYSRLAPGGILFLHDYSSLHWNGAKLAVDEFCKTSGEFIVLMPDKAGSAFLRRSRR